MVTGAVAPVSEPRVAERQGRNRRSLAAALVGLRFFLPLAPASASASPRASGIAAGDSQWQGNSSDPTSDEPWRPSALQEATRARRTTAVGTEFSVDAVLGSNVGAAAQSADNVDVRAGVSYPLFKIHAVSGLGTTQALIRVKLVPYDLALATCTTAVPETSERPFNGLAGVANPNPEETINTFPNVKFPRAGQFRLCYSATGAFWEELRTGITVFGSELNTNKFWCPLSNLKKDECATVVPIPSYCHCTGKVEGFKRSSQTGALMGLGLPDPPSPPWRTMLAFMDSECGVGNANPFENKVSEVVPFEGYEVHNFGMRQPGTELGVWKVCYCAGIDGDTSTADGSCYSEAAVDFPQTAGQVATLDVKTQQGSLDVTVYPTLRFSLVLQCGSNGQVVQPDSQSGGCESTGASRYKVVVRTAENDLAYYEADSGCQYLPQAVTFQDGRKILGGQVGPDNCVEPVRCLDDPEVLGPQTPTWNEVQIDATYQNNVMIRGEYDVCYCDGNCENSAYWFKAGEFIVRPVNVFFTAVTDGSSTFSPVVNTRAYLVLQGTEGPGSWSTEADGTMTRELKILRDCPGCVGKLACLQDEMPEVVSGHRLVSGNTDYTEPETLYNADLQPIGQRYGRICNSEDPPTCVPNLKISDAGWYAICYCDSNCNEMLNWAVYGRALVAGPLQGQTWSQYAGVTFNIDVKGWGFGITDRLLVLPPSNLPVDCGAFAKSSNVNGPASEAKLLASSTNVALVLSMAWDSRGTVITFDKVHGLVDGDRIALTGVNVPGQPPTLDTDMARKMTDMFNSVHEVYRECDADGCYKILIPVEFPAAEFPTIELSSVVWTRNSVETFENIKVRFGQPSPEGRGYVVCWSQRGQDQADFVGQAGTITVKTPANMENAALGLTSVMPDAPGGGSPVVITFVTGDVARYEQMTGQMQLVIAVMPGRPDGATAYINALEPRNYALDDLVIDEKYNVLSEATQNFCGQVFLEMWTSDPDGFPQPEGCWFDEDDTDPDLVVNSRGVKQIHILFSPRNHLKKNTHYMLVMNMNIKADLTADFPDNGPVWIWSMDDVHTDPYNVIELGLAKPSPASRVPPRDVSGNLQLSSGDDPQFDLAAGFRIHPDDSLGSRVKELTGHCKAYSPRTPEETPTEAMQCIPCRKEEDCGNGGNGVLPNPLVTFCVSPMDGRCPQVAGDNTNVPAFLFDVQAKTGHPIIRSSIIRVFLHPLTQWSVESSCRVAMEVCQGPAGGGQCANPTCASETVVGGPVIGVTEYPINILKVTLPPIMGDIADNIVDTVKVGNLPLPSGGFFPESIAAELMKSDQTAPDYWDRNREALAGARLYVQPRILSAALVTRDGEGNSLPFRGDQNNKLYIRVVFGATLWARVGEAIRLRFRLPPGYSCTTETNAPPLPELAFLQGNFPTLQGRLGGLADETVWVRIDGTGGTEQACELQYRIHMITYAGAALFTEVTVDNPSTALKADAAENRWTLILTNTDYNPNLLPTLADYTLGPYALTSCGATRQRFLCRTDLSTEDYGAMVSVLGKLTDAIIAPSNFGVSQLNLLSIFFRTEQEVGTLDRRETELWVDAPPTFDFGQYCVASRLQDFYYIPEGRGTEPLPTGDLIVCEGAPTDSTQLTYNRAKVRTTGRLLQSTLYGFHLEVVNSPRYIRSQLDGWRIWTYTIDGRGVDGTFETPRFNEMDAVGASTSFGVYLRNIPAGNFQVAISDLRPTLGGLAPTDITLLPIVVSVPMSRGFRVLAPAGFVWYFEQFEFRYKAPAPGVVESLIVQGAEQDLPISGVPARPIAEPRNRLTMDYMQTSWQPGVRYGFAAKIIVPLVGPTGSANQFTIEFGYSEELHEDRLEAGAVAAPLVRKIINGGLSSTTAIVSQTAQITFSLRTISAIPTAGAIMIIGPPNFQFSQLCQPKPSPGFPELPYDSTCLFSSIMSTGEAEVSIVAGPSGIPARHYMFSIEGTNPPASMLEGAYKWTILTYSLASEKTLLDYNTTVSSLAVGSLMRAASLIMWPWTQCLFRTLEQQAQDPSQPITYCDFERWQFYPPQGYRDDRPGRSSQLIIAMQLESSSFGVSDIIVRAPAGYEFNAECSVVTYPSSRIFNDSATDGVLQSLPEAVPLDASIPSPDSPYTTSQRRFDQRYALWPVDASVDGCVGRANVARITIREGLTKYSKYVFRLAVLRNPLTTPDPNLFVLEYNGESSEPFEGVKIWAFANGTVLPTTTAASLRNRNTENLVTIHLRPINDLPTGGHLRITAPSGFIIPTVCSISVEVHESESRFNLDSVPAGVDQVTMRRYLEFFASDLSCQGDETPSSQCRIRFSNSKYLHADVLYVFSLNVINPQTTSGSYDTWEFHSYRDLTVNDLIDSASVPGFPINSAMEDFRYIEPPESNNALTKHRLDFNMSFPDPVEIGDTISIVAPVSYIFNEPGDSRCPQYIYLEGSMRRTQPRCGANTISWHLQQESIPAMTGVRFMVQVQNPPRTPDSNLFQVRQTGPDGMRKSSRMIPGYDIIPKLENVTVMKVSPTNPCQPTITLVTGEVCEGTGSFGSIELHFTPTRSAEVVQIQGHVSGQPFSLLTAFFGNSVPTYARSATSIAASKQLHANQQEVLRLDNVENPAVAGLAQWSITTFTTAQVIGETTTTTLFPPPTCDSIRPCGSFPSGGSRRDESLDLPAFSILGYIQVLSTSRVNPIFFGATSATATFEVQLRYDLLPEDVFRITRPPSYRVIADSLQTFRDLSVGEHGLDLMRRWSANYTNPEDYYMVIKSTITADTDILFSIRADLPAVPQRTTNWFFRTYRILPLLDTDGEVLESGPVPYPWIGRDLQTVGTNDGASSSFSGFPLVGEIPFVIAPMLQTPGAEIRLSLNFNLAEGVEAAQYVRFEVKGPEGFVFRDTDCFYQGSQEFEKCTGFRNTATLKSARRILIGADLFVYLAVTNPGVTPSPNYWELAVFKDEETQYVRWSNTLGYTIMSMRVTYKGNNQLGESASGFFTFTPVRSSPSAQVYITVTPPPEGGFRMFCTGVSPLGFGSVSECSSGGANEILELRFDNASLVADQAYTFGVRVYNPGGRPSTALNYWGITLKDQTRQAFDGNLRIPGLELRSVPVRCNGLGWTTAMPRVLGTVLVQLRVLYDMLGGTVTEIVIVAPEGVMYNEDPSTLQIIPLPLPLSTARPVTIGGDLLTLNLDQNRNVDAGLYNIRFDVSNPSIYPHDNTWSVLVRKDIELLFSHVFTGYTQGEVSPFDLSTTVGLANSGSSRCGSSYLLPAVVAVTVVAVTALWLPPA